MLLGTLFTLTALLYAVASALFLVLLVRGNEKSGSWATRALAGAVILHLTYVLDEWLVLGRRPLADTHGTLSTLSLLLVVAFLLATLRYRIKVLGAFITPITLLFLLGAGFAGSVGPVPAGVRSALLPVHVSLNVLGIVAFGLAFATAVGYMIQERQLRRKNLSGVFQRLPALDVLDTLGFRLIVVGFPLLTLGIVTGTVWAVRMDAERSVISAAQGFALLTWLVFAAVLVLRGAVGWRGRRAAIGTIMGFTCAMAVLASYVMRAGGGL